MNLQMYPLDNPLTTRPIQTCREIIIEQYLKLQFRCIAKQEHKLGKGSVSTQTKTRSDSPEPLLLLHSKRESGPFCGPATGKGIQYN
jgi:hypothetical protein